MDSCSNSCSKERSFSLAWLAARMGRKPMLGVKQAARGCQCSANGQAAYRAGLKHDCWSGMHHTAYGTTNLALTGAHLSAAILQDSLQANSAQQMTQALVVSRLLQQPNQGVERGSCKATHSFVCHVFTVAEQARLRIRRGGRGSRSI
jgi:hypothetical protein